MSVLLEEPDPIVVYMQPNIPPACVGGTTTIQIDSVTGGSGGFTYSINGGQQYPIDSSITLPVGFYNIIVTDMSGCTDTTPVSVIAPDPILLDIIPMDPVIDLGDSVQLELLIENTQGPVDSIAWAHDENGQLSCYDCGEPWAFNLIPTTYFVQVWDSVGCLVESSVTVDVNNRRNVYLPNVFTPNLDGHNENFMIFTGQGVTGIRSVRVFNRWGELMTEVRDLPPSPDGAVVWDGQFKGKTMQPGVFVYIAEVMFADRPNDPIIIKGDVTLLR